MMIKTKQRIGVVKITVKQGQSVMGKKSVPLSGVRIPRTRQKVLAAKSGERKSSAYGYIYSQEEEDTARAMSVLEKYAQKG